MIRLLSDALRRNPYPLYDVLRRVSPVLHDRLHGLWLLFDYDSVERALNDHDAFSSRAAPPGGKPLECMIFQDPPIHTKLRGLIMRTFTPRAIAGLEPRIAQLSRELLDDAIERGGGEMELVGEYAVPLPLTVIAAGDRWHPHRRPAAVRRLEQGDPRTRRDRHGWRGGREGAPFSSPGARRRQT